MKCIEERAAMLGVACLIGSGMDTCAQTVEVVMPLLEVNTAIVEKFDDFEGTAHSLPPGFAVSKDGIGIMSAGDEDFRGISPGNVTAGGCYAWRIGDGDRALGYQPTSDEFTPGFFQLTISNATGRLLRHVEVSYVIVWQNNADRASCLELCFSTDGIYFETLAGSRFVTPGPKEACAGWSRRHFDFLITLPDALKPGSIFRLRWRGDDAGGSGSRDEYGIDELSIKAKAALGTVFRVF